MEQTEINGFHVVCGTSPKNGIDGRNRILHLGDFNSLLVADLDYFVEHHERILEMAKERIEARNESTPITDEQMTNAIREHNEISRTMPPPQTL